MIQYSEQSPSTQSPSAPVYENEVLDHSLTREKVSLSQIWQYLTRTKCLPDGLDLDVFFTVIRDKLKDPEWEVRQHTLRVLRDFVQIVDSSCADSKTESIFDDLLLNLGHISPAVRKAAVDCLRTYLKQSKDANDILRGLLNKILENSKYTNAQPNIVLGTILAAPFLILSSTSSDTLLYLIQQLLDKIPEEIYKEAAIRSLVHVRNVIGESKFYEYLEMSSSRISKGSFDSMCASYDLEFENHHQQLINSNNRGNRSAWNDFNDNFLNEMDYSLRMGRLLDEVSQTHETLIEDRVILETEIQLDSGPAVTMQLHEQSRQNSFNETTDSEEETRQNAGIVKVLTDDSEQDDEIRRTPRRVRFGGEVVKMRTPDSDSNGTGDENEATKTKRYTKSAQNVRSFIPVRITENRKCRSEPNSPQRVNKTRKHGIYISVPDLSKTKHVFGPKVKGVSKIPRRNKPVFHSTIKITIDSNPKKPIVYKAEEMVNKEKSIPKPEKQQPKNVDNKQNLLNSPTTHQGIEILYNLTQSPQRVKNEEKPEVECCKENSEDHLTRPIASLDAKENNLNKGSNSESSSTVVDQKDKRNFDSFQVCDVHFGDDYKERNASFVAVSAFPKNGDERSESSTAYQIKDIMRDLQRQEDVTTRLRGLKSLFKVLKNSTPLEFIQDSIAQIFNLLFSAFDQPALRLLAQEILSFLFENMNASILKSKLNQIAPFLGKTGVPDGVVLAMKLIKNLPVSLLIDQLLSKPILNAKSSKMREGSIQILIGICSLCPSTDIDVPKIAKSVVGTLADKKRKVRQAALELLAVLAQLKSIALLLDITTTETKDHPEGERIIRALRNRLSRKQLPSVDTNGQIRYSTPIGESELEWLSLGIGSPPEQRIASSQRRIHSTSGEINNNYSAGYWQRDDRFKDASSNRALKTHSATSTGWSRGSSNYKDHGDGNFNRPGLWAIESPSTGVGSQPIISGTLRPIYVLPPNILTTANISDLNKYKIEEIGSRPHDETSSFCGSSRSKLSSPKKNSANLTSNSHHYINKFNGDSNRELFRKSFSSDSICSKEKAATTQLVSSGCSSTSGSSTRSGTWHRETRSGIPVPVTRTKFRSKYFEPNTMQLPHETRFRSKATSPEKQSSPLSRVIALPEHFSSGSESSGYFTPPAEAPNSGYSYTAERIPSAKQETESFIRIDSASSDTHSSKTDRPPSQIGDGAYNINPGEAVEPQPIVEEIEESSFIIQESDQDESDRNVSRTERESAVESLDNVDFNRKIYVIGERNFSKSEVDLKQVANENRPLKSAPLRNEYCHAPVYHTVNETTINITNVALPGSVDVTVQSEVKTVEVAEDEKAEPQKKVVKRTLSRTLSKRSTKSDEVSSENGQPFSKPKEALAEALSQLESNDWEATIKGLKALVRLKKHNPEVLEPQMHSICVALGKQVKNLRSQVARAACTAASELFVEHKKSLETEVDEIAIPLLQRTADTNKFLRSDANSALDVMCATLPPPKVVAIITSKGCTHQNALVRAASARLLCNLVHRLGADKVFQMPRETRDKVLLAGANMLLDGNLDTRKSAKMMLSHLCSHTHFHKAILEVVPACTMRHIQKTLKSLK